MHRTLFRPVHRFGYRRYRVRACLYGPWLPFIPPDWSSIETIAVGASTRAMTPPMCARGSAAAAPGIQQPLRLRTAKAPYGTFFKPISAPPLRARAFGRYCLKSIL